jgi:hypothetical protein
MMFTYCNGVSTRWQWSLNIADDDASIRNHFVLGFVLAFSGIMSCKVSFDTSLCT